MTTRTCYTSRKNNEDYFIEVEDVVAGSGHEWDNVIVDHRIEKEAILKFNGICDSNPIVLSEVIRNWLKENNVSYTTSLDCACRFNENESCDGVKWYIDIPDDDKALLFKLTWG
jgi:hypothetical protein